MQLSLVCSTLLLLGTAAAGVIKRQDFAIPAVSAPSWNKHITDNYKNISDTCLDFGFPHGWNTQGQTVWPINTFKGTCLNDKNYPVVSILDLNNCLGYKNGTGQLVWEDTPHGGLA